MTTVAIFSPNENAYSETFIHAHKELPFNIKYYWGGWLPRRLEGANDYGKLNFWGKINFKTSKTFSLAEYVLMRSLKKEKVHCILAEYGPTACATLNIAKHLKIPMVVHFHGFDASVKSILQEYANGYRLMFDYATKVVVVSNKMKDALLSLGCPVDRLIISPYGPSDIYFANKPQYLNRQFVSVGRFVEKKAPYLTIIAFSNLVKVFPEAKLVFVGDGQLLEVCKNLAKALGVANSIDFKGVLKPTQIKELFENSIAFVQHSVTAENGDSEGTPVAILEAQAASLPVISTFHAGISDVVVNNTTGLLVKEHDVEGMFKNMVRILSEKGLAEFLGKSAKERILKKFTITKHLTELEKIIECAI